MASLRHQRVRELLKRELGLILQRRMPLDTYGLMSIHEVFVSGDLKNAKILVGQIGNPDQRKQAGAYLAAHRGEIQREMASRVVMKYTPHIRFAFDDSLERGDRVLSILESLEFGTGSNIWKAATTANSLS